MNITFAKACGALALALSVITVPALAGGSVGGGKGAVVPVPAPSPVPDYYGQFYLRLDAAYNWSDANRFDTGNDLYNQNRRRDEGLTESGRFGFGAGMYFNRWLRGDVTIDTREEATGYVRDTIQYAVGLDTATDTLTDRIRYRNGVGLANIYIDLPFSPRFTPYVGAGVGVVIHGMSRELDQTITCANGGGGCGGYPISNTVHDKDFQWAFAGALMAGFSYQISDSLKTDIGYRWLHLDGASFSHWVGTQLAYQKVQIADQNLHEMRIGLRWDLQ